MPNCAATPRRVYDERRRRAGAEARVPSALRLPWVSLLVLGVACAIDDRNPDGPMATQTTAPSSTSETPGTAAPAESSSNAGIATDSGTRSPTANGNAGAAPRGSNPSPSTAVAERPANDPALVTPPAASGGQTPAAASPSCTTASHSLNWDDIYKTVASDLAGAASTDAPFYRYLSVANRLDSGCDGAALDPDRQAVTQLVNMLSTAATPVAPKAIDTDRTLFRLDERDYGWNRPISVQGNRFTDVWEAVIASDRFAVPFAGTEANQAVSASGTTVPVAFADSFLAAAAIGEQYYAILGIDTNQSADGFISGVLKVDVAADLASSSQVRAGTTRSRIARTDRLAQRDALPAASGGGELWQAFNIDPTQGDLFAKPLATPAGERFLMFTLPNGLFAFAVANASGSFVPSSDFVLDTKQKDLRAVASISCASCHGGGILAVVDEVEPSTLTNVQVPPLTPADLARVQSIYVAPADFARTVASDTATYQAALTSLEVPTSGAAPVASAFVQFETDLALANAAGDLGVTADELRKNLNLLGPALQVLNGGVLSRDNFAAVYVTSLCTVSLSLNNQPDAAVCSAAAAASGN